MKKIVNILTIIIICSFVTSIRNFVNASPEQGYVVYVNGGSYKVKTNITGENVFFSTDASTSIQWAIDNIGDIEINGGEVLLEAGDYPLSNCIVIKDNIWLHGRGKSTLLYTNGQIMEAIVVQDASMAVLSDFALSNKNNGIESAVGVIVERSVNCQVLHLFISGFHRGIFNRGESSMTLINGNTLTNNRTNLDIADGGDVIGRWIPILVSENIIVGGETGISCKALCTNKIKNTISNLYGRGIVAQGNSILVRENKISDIKGDYAIYGSQAEFNCTDNILTNIKGNGILTKCRWGTTTGNIIKNCGNQGGGGIGIHIYSDNPVTAGGPAESKVIFSNTIYNKEGNPLMEYGIKEEGLKNVISENKISGYKKAIHSEGDSTVVINNIIKK